MAKQKQSDETQLPPKAEEIPKANATPKFGVGGFPVGSYEGKARIGKCQDCSK